MAETTYDRKIAVVIFGTDRKGEMFQEDSVTKVVAHDWALIQLRHGVDPGGELIVFNKENGNQAEFLMDSAPAPGEAKILLRDHGMDVWQLDFGFPAPPEPDLRTKEYLVCSACHTLEAVKLEATEDLAMFRDGHLTRYCAACMTETKWELKSAVDARAAAAPAPAPAPVAAAQPVPKPAAAVAAPVPAHPAAPPAPAPPAAPVPERVGADRRESKRIMLKTKARIRRRSGSEVVAPLNVSRGGIAFESRASYELDEVIWVSMHFREGDPNPLETTSRIVRVTRGGGEKPHSYGVNFAA